MSPIKVILNPIAGRGYGGRAEPEIRRLLEARGVDFDLVLTEGLGHAVELAERAVRDGFEIVVAAGGDGTVHEVVNGLVGSDTAMGVLPVGTGNVWAKEIGLPTMSLAQSDRLLSAARMLVDGEVRWVDVGRAGDRNFLNSAGVGIDASVAAQVEPRTRTAKQLGGVIPYLVAGLSIARDFQGMRSTIILDGRTVRTMMLLVVVSNIQLYGGVVKMTPEARLDDGLLDVRIFRGMGPSWVFRHVAGVFTRRHLRNPMVLHCQARHVAIHTDEPVPVQLDGDPVTVVMAEQTYRRQNEQSDRPERHEERAHAGTAGLR